MISKGPGPPDRPTAIAPLGAVVLIAYAYVLCAVIVSTFLRPDYDFLSSPISMYAIGPYGLLTTTALFVWGAASLVLAVGLYLGLAPRARSSVGLVLLAVFGVGLVVTSLIPMDVPYRPFHFTSTGAVHVFFASLSTACFPPAALLVAWSVRLDARWQAIHTHLVRLAGACFVVAPVVVFTGNFYLPVFGLVQKAYAVLALSWLLLVANRLRLAAAG
ncbi:MAG TPA: DUF998 domain-containing protein [Gemmataceae bacterium]|jgi:hypothetical protein|nr:DUF998 domain-containing protein [Gemmataceae bacterium]